MTTPPRRHQHGSSALRRQFVALAGALVTALLLSPAAGAGQIRVAGATLSYVGGGEANDVLVALDVAPDASYTFLRDNAGGITMDTAATEVCQLHPDGNRAWCSADFTAIRLEGWGGNDKLTVDEGITVPATIDGGAGDDALTGGGGADTLLGGAGPFADCSGSTSDRDDLRGRGGIDTATYAGRSPSVYNVTVSLDNVDNDGTTYTSPTTCSGWGGSYRPSAVERDDVGSDIENVIGTQGADTLIGSNAANVLTGTGGNDILHGGGGNDTLNGGSQNDELYGGANDDDLFGELSNDMLDGGAGQDRYEGGDGNDALTSRDNVSETEIRCGAGTDTLQRDPVDSISAGDCESFSPRAQGAPTLSGTPTEGQLLTATAAWEAAPTPSEGYQWWRCDGAGEACSPIVGATSRSYLLSDDDVGKRLYVRVTATNSLGTDVADSVKTAPVADGAPVNSAAPSVSGTPREGSTLTAGPGTWTSLDPVTYAYAWERCAPAGGCTSVPGASAQTYALGPADVGQQMRVVVTATNRIDSSSAPSARTATVTELDVTAPQTTIDSPPTSGTSTSASIAFSSNEAGSTFACSLDGAPFASCTSPATYTALAPGMHIFRVRATDPAGNTDVTPAEATWAVTAVIIDPPPSAKCNVPGLKGKTLAQARTALTKANCALGKITRAYSAKAKKGRVLKQSPAAGRTLAKGAKVTVTLSKGKRR